METTLIAIVFLLLGAAAGYSVRRFLAARRLGDVEEKAKKGIAEAEAKAKAQTEAARLAREAEEAAAKKKAGSSLKPRAASGPIGRGAGSTSSGESVRATLQRSIKESMGS